MAVAIDVSDADTQCPKPLQLGVALDRDMFGRDPTGDCAAHEPAEGIERSAARFPECGHLFRLGDGGADSEIEMETDLQRGSVAQARNCINQAGGVGEQRRRGYAPRRMRLADPAVYPRRQAEVVGVDDQSSFSDSALASCSSES